MRKINEIILHCTATKEGLNFGVKDVDRWHRDRGFKCIGYHYLILLDGTVCPGRPLNEIGAHTTGHNAYSIGVCYVGGLDKNGKPKDTRTPEQKLAMYKLLYDLLNTYPKAQVSCHYQYAAKACPCFKIEDLQREYHLWLQINKLPKPKMSMVNL